MSAIRSSMFFKKKFTPEGNFLKLKSRLIVGDDQQDRAQYEDVFSPSASIIVIFNSTDYSSSGEQTRSYFGLSWCISRRINVISSGTYIL